MCNPTCIRFTILLEKHIPEAARFLLRRMKSSEWEHPDRLVDFLHTRGINLRYLGLFRKFVEFLGRDLEEKSNVRSLSNCILGEMIARTAKYILRERLRKLGHAPEEYRRKAIVSFFNALQGREDTGGCDLEPLAKILWQEEIPKIIERKFVGGLSESEKFEDLRPE